MVADAPAAPDDRRDNKRSLPRRGASVILIRRGAVLMVERAKPPFKGLWSFPGGGVEAGEDGEAAARRELREETGLEVAALRRLDSFRPLPGHSTMEIEVFCGHAPDGEPRPGDDARQAAFIPFADTGRRPMTPGATGWISRAVVALSGLDEFFAGG